MLTATWLKQIFQGQKKLLKASEVHHLNPPRFEEISVKNLYAQCLEMDKMAAYFPDTYPKGRQCDREYFFTVLGALHPVYARQLILKAKENRYKIDEA